MPEKKMITLYVTCFAVTVEEYEQARRELVARALAGDITMLERIAYEALEYGQPRYHELKIHGDIIDEDDFDEFRNAIARNAKRNTGRK